MGPLEIFKLIYEGLKGLKPAQVARAVAYIYAPGAILLLTITGYLGGGFSVANDRPVAISELRSELTSDGGTKAKVGVALVIEPIDKEFRFRFEAPPGRLWSSLDELTARSNRDRLIVDGNDLRSRAPFSGVVGPVTVVVEGKMEKDVYLPGAVENVDKMLLTSRRSAGVMTATLLACIFALGMSSATGLPSTNSKQYARR